MAEPRTPQEQRFLQQQVSRFHGNNFWLGLRRTEECSCSGGRRARIDHAGVHAR